MKDKSSVDVFSEMGLDSAYPTCFLKDCIDEMLPKGFSRVGGIPSVPEDFEWPMDELRSLPFIGQFKGSEAAASWFGCAGRTLKEGLYYVFFSPDSFYGKRPEEETESGFKRKTGVKVLYYPDEVAELRDHKAPKDIEDSIKSPIHLQSLSLYSIPEEDFRSNSSSDHISISNLPAGMLEAIRTMPYEVEPVTRMRVGGFPTRIDGLDLSPMDHFDIFYEGGIEMNDRWVLFAEFQMNLEPLYVDSSKNICLWIRGGDLASQNFDEVFATMN